MSQPVVLWSAKSPGGEIRAHLQRRADPGEPPRYARRVAAKGCLAYDPVQCEKSADVESP